MAGKRRAESRGARACPLLDMCVCLRECQYVCVLVCRDMHSERVWVRVCVHVCMGGAYTLFIKKKKKEGKRSREMWVEECVDCVCVWCVLCVCVCVCVLCVCVRVCVILRILRG